MDKDNDLPNIFIKCRCWTEGILVIKDPDSDLFYLSMAYLGVGGGKIPFWERVKMMWKILRQKRFETSEIVLTSGDAQRLQNFFNQNKSQADDLSE